MRTKFVIVDATFNYFLFTPLVLLFWYGTYILIDSYVLSQFESALPRLRELAGSFFDLTAGNNVVLLVVAGLILVWHGFAKARSERATPN